MPTESHDAASLRKQVARHFGLKNNELIRLGNDYMRFQHLSTHNSFKTYKVCVVGR